MADRFLFALGQKQPLALWCWNIYHSAWCELFSASWKNVVGTGCQSGLGQTKNSFVINLSLSTVSLCDWWVTCSWIYTVWLTIHYLLQQHCHQLLSAFMQSEVKTILLECWLNVTFKLKYMLLWWALWPFCKFLDVCGDCSVACVVAGIQFLLVALPHLFLSCSYLYTLQTILL